MSTDYPEPQTHDAPGASKRGSLGSHRVLHFTGQDAATFLQGYLTCDTRKLEPHQARPGAFTNLKGRVVANGWVWGNSTKVSMLIAESLTATVADFLKPYLNFSRTTLHIEKAPPAVQLGGDIGTDSVALDARRAVLHDAEGLTEDLSTGWLDYCISTSEVVITAAVSGAFLPQMLGLTALGAVSFDKGCYLGQEVVARAQHRGEVKRHIQQASYQALTPLSAGDTLSNSTGKNLATVICATANTLLLVSSDTLTGDHELQAGGIAVELSFPTPQPEL